MNMLRAVALALLLLPGIASAQYNLAVVYASGRGVMRDEAEAVLWYRKAAAQGYAPAAERLKSLDTAGAK